MQKNESPTEHALPDGIVKVFEADPDEGDRTRMYVLDVLGVSVMIYQRKDGRRFVHVDSLIPESALPEGSEGLALALEVNNGGDSYYGEDEEDEETEPVVTISQERGYDGPWTARCTCKWSSDHGSATDAQLAARVHEDETGHDASGA